jgi:type I restriction enzyme S subunit
METCTLGDVVNLGPHETLPKGMVAKKIAMEQLQPFTKSISISKYEYALFNGGSKFRNGNTIMARITPCFENGKTVQVNILNDDAIGFGSIEFIVLRNIENVFG